jgi:hypothetical protein
MKRIYYILTILAVAFYASAVFAKADLSISDSDLFLSKNVSFEGDTVRIYARIFNTGDVDVSANVVFSDGKKEIGNAQPISLKPNTYDDVWIDWKPAKGDYTISAKINAVNPPDETTDNNKAVLQSVFVDTDTNKNGIGDIKDAETAAIVAKQEAQKIAEAKLAEANNTENLTDKTDAADAINNQESPSAELSKVASVASEGLTTVGKDIKNILTAEPNALKDFQVDTSKYSASLFGSIGSLFVGKNWYYYWGLGLLSLVILYFMFKKKKRR